MHLQRSPLSRSMSHLVYALTAALLIGCGGGGSASPVVDASRAASIVFPPGRAITMAPVLTVRGVVLEPSDVIGVTANGVSATSSDGFATWTAQVPLAQGDNPIEVLVDRGTGGLRETDVVVRREGPVPLNFVDVALDATAGVVYMVDRGGVLIAMDTGVRRHIPGHAKRGNNSTAYTLAVDQTTGLLYLAESNSSVFRLSVIDPNSGATTVLSESGDGKGLAIHTILFPRRLAIDPVAGMALVLNTSVGGGIANQLVGVDLVTGIRTSLYEEPSGPGTDRFNDLAALPGTGTVILADSNAVHTLTLATGTLAPLASPGAVYLALDVAALQLFTYADDGVYRIDATTGTHTLISPSAGLADDVRNLVSSGLWFDPTSGDLLAIARLDGVVRIDVATGARTRLYDFAVTGSFTFPSDLICDADGHLVYCNGSDFYVEGVDLPSGVRGILSGGGVGSGPLLEAPQGIAAGDSPGRAYLGNADITPNPIYEVDLSTGDRTIVSDATTGTGVGIEYTIDMDRAADGTLYVSDEDGDQVVAVDPLTGNRTRIVGTGVGSGPNVVSYEGLDYDDATGTLYLCDRGATNSPSRILAIDPLTGERSVFLEGTAYTPARDLDLNDVAVSPDGADVYFVDDDDATLHHVDVATGTPRVILDPATTAGFPLARPTRIAESPQAGVLFITDIIYDGIFAVDVTTGESVLIAR